MTFYSAADAAVRKGKEWKGKNRKEKKRSISPAVDTTRSFLCIIQKSGSQEP
jgi:hypothetical protein